MPILGDDLIARVAAIEPARTLPPLSKSSIHNLIRGATAARRESRTWTWPRYRLASIGALLGSSAVAVAAIVGLDAAGTPLPVASSAHMSRSHPPVAQPSYSEAFQYASVSSIGYSDASGSVLSGRTTSCPVTLQLRATSSTSIPLGPGHADAFRILSALSPRRALSALAPTFALSTTRVMWYPRSAHSRAWWVGTLDGPSLTTFSSAGITWWSYAGAREPVRQQVREAGPRGQNLLSSAASSLDAAQLLSRLGVAGHLGSPVESRSGTSVEVSVPFMARGLVSDERFDVTYGARGRLAASEGPLITIAREVVYPVISPRRAVQLLRRPLGALTGLLAPTATTRAPIASRSTPTAVCLVPSGVDPVSSASMTLSTRELSNGLVWLLPSWTFSAWPNRTVRVPSAGDATLVAISPRLLDYGPAAIRYRHHRAAR